MVESRDEVIEKLYQNFSKYQSPMADVVRTMYGVNAPKPKAEERTFSKIVGTDISIVPTRDKLAEAGERECKRKINAKRRQEEIQDAVQMAQQSYYSRLVEEPFEEGAQAMLKTLQHARKKHI